MFWGAEVKIPIFEFWQGIKFSPGTVQFCEILWRNPNLWNTESKTVLRWLLTIKMIKKYEKVKWKSLSCVWLFVTPWTIQSMEFSRPEYWSGEPFPSPGDLPNPGIEPRSPALQADSLPAEPQGKPPKYE